MDKPVYTITCPYCGAKYSTYDYTRLTFNSAGFRYCALCHNSFMVAMDGGGGGNIQSTSADSYTPKV